MSTIISQPKFTCALGAQQTVAAIPRGIPIIHAGPGCSQNAFSILAKSAGNQGEGYAGGNHISCTNTSESEVVFGGEKNLRSLISGALKVLDGDLYVALSGCTAGIIGDDTESVAKEFAEEGYAVVGVDTAGFRGNNYFGHELVIKAIVDQYVENVKAEPQQGLVNVFCVVPYQNPFWRGDLERIKELLEGIGLKANVLFGSESAGVSEWKQIPNAQFNLLLSPWVGLNTVKYLESKYKTPFLHYPVLPVGARETSRFLRKVTEYAGLDKEKTEEYIRKQEKRYYEYFLSLSDFISLYQNNLPYELYVAGDSLYSIAYAHYLEDEVGFIPKGIYIADDPGPENEKALKHLVEEILPDYPDALIIEADAELTSDILKEELAKTSRAVVLGTDWERGLVKESGNLFLYAAAPISQDIIIRKSYVGYKGGLDLLEDLYKSIFAGRDVSANNYIRKLSE